MKTGKVKLHELPASQQLEIVEILKERAPLKIEGEVKISIRMKNGYDDIQYKWSSEGYNYEMRWHTATPTHLKVLLLIGELAEKNRFCWWERSSYWRNITRI